MATIRKRKTKSGYYVVDFTYKGRRHVLTTKTKNTDVAKRILQNIEARIALGIFDIKDYQDSCILLGDAINKYIEEEAPNKSPKTIKNEIQQLNNFAEFFPRRDISSILYDNIITWRNNRIEKVSRITINNECRVLHHFFNWCIERGYIKRNPLSNLRMLKVDQSRRLYMSKDELKAVMDKIHSARMKAR